ncbi:hypothetical protein DM02DRAFT_618563 [Periconia macrospinosa]|uniref:Uncharacterized protein n=1 Tax=Periconia macrospinosa TaxID=97972 RepID=A0A2V1DAG8_9PLEO|nr:hypothetical protein DM02DRAFT_618563 [Periconia macrospinosa]
MAEEGREMKAEALVFASEAGRERQAKEKERKRGGGHGRVIGLGSVVSMLVVRVRCEAGGRGGGPITTAYA